MRIFKKILLICAGAILVLHSLVPHQHNNLGSSEVGASHQSITSIFDYISLAIHLDLGDHHLEDFLTPEADLDIDINAADFNLLTFYLFETISFNIGQEVNFIDNRPPQIKEQSKTRTDQFRGPPALS